MARRFTLEPLEPRLLLSGDPYSAALASDGLDADLQQLDARSTSQLFELDSDVRSPSIRSTEQSSRQILVVDSRLKDYESLLAELSLDKASDFEIVILDANRDGISQITDVLANHDDIQGLHILSHGSNGSLTLGSTSLSSENIDAYSEQFRVWRNVLGIDADILLYGCNVADGEWGIGFVQELAAMTGADVAASTDLTGAAVLGGDWALEYRTGTIEATSLAGGDYAGLLVDEDTPIENVVDVLGLFRSGLDEGIDAVFDLNLALPLIGNSSTQLLEARDALKDTIEDLMGGLINQLANNSTLADVKEAIFQLAKPDDPNDPNDSAGPLHGIVVDENDDPIETRDDIQFEASPELIQLNLRLKQEFDLADLPIDFNEAVPGLGLAIDGATELELQASYVFEFGLGTHEADGFFLDTIGAIGTGEELVLTLDATVADDLDASATLSLPGIEGGPPPVNPVAFEAQVEEFVDGTPSGLFATISLDLVDPDDNGRFTADEIATSTPADVVIGRFQGVADVDLLMDVGVDGLPQLFIDLAPGIDGFRAIFHYDQVFVDVDTTGAAIIGAPVIAFETLDGFEDNFLGTLSISDFTDGVAGLLGDLSDAVDQALGGLGELPIVGDQIRAGIEPFLNSIAELGDLFERQVEAIFANAGVDPDESLADQLEGALFGLFDRLNILKDNNGDTLITQDDIVRTEGSDRIEIAEGLLFPIPFTNWIEWDIHLGQDTEFAIPFEFGLDLASLGLPADLFGFEIDADRGLVIDLGWALHTGLGFTLGNLTNPQRENDVNPGFYLKDRVDENGDPIPEFEASITVGSPVDPATDEIIPVGGLLTVGLIAATVTDGTPDADEDVKETEVSIGVTADITDGSAPEEVNPNDQSTFGRIAFDDIQIDNDASADASLRFHVDGDPSKLDGFAGQGFGVGPGTLGLPEVSFDLILDASAGGDDPGLETLKFDNITLGLGPLIENLVDPIGDVIEAFLQPIGAILEFLDSSIPVVSEVPGIGDPSILSLLSRASGLDLGDLTNKATQLVTSLTAIGAKASDLGDVNLGCIEYNPDTGRFELCEDFVNLFDEFTIENGVDPGGFELSILRPESILNYFSGETFDIVSYDLPGGSLAAGRGFGASIGPISLGVRADADFTVADELAFTYDSAGLEKVIGALRAGADPNYADLKDGFYVGNDPDARDVELALSASGGGGFSAGVGPAKVSASARVNLDGSAFLDLQDPNNDGKLRFNEIDRLTGGLSNPAGVLALFDAGVDIGGGLSISASGISIGGAFSAGVSLTDVFGPAASQKPALSPIEDPILASVIQVGGQTVLRINTGPFAANRIAGVPNGSPNDSGGASFTVTGAAGSYTVTNNNSGESTVHTGSFSKIVIIGGDGPDHFDLSAVDIAVEVRGNGGDDEIHTGAGNDTVSGGLGNDTIHTGAGADTVDGGRGVDEIHAGIGNDIVLGGADADIVFGDQGDDLLDGQGGPDTVDGGQGADIVLGGEGDDDLDGGADDDLVDGGGGNDRVDGGAGNDLQRGGRGRDTLLSRRSLPGLLVGRDAIFGGTGDDTVVIDQFAEATIFGDTGFNTLEINDVHTDASIDEPLAATLTRDRFAVDTGSGIATTSYSDIDRVEVILGTRPDAFTIQSTATPVNVDGSAARLEADTLILDRTHDVTDRSGVLTSERITGFGVDPIHYTAN